MGNKCCMEYKNHCRDICCCCCEETYEYPIIFEVKRKDRVDIISFPEIPVKYSYIKDDNDEYNRIYKRSF
jgi:hypothetical protein